ncbi:hypothetical protein ACFLQ0_03330 [Nitrospinota bacterium]
MKRSIISFRSARRFGRFTLLVALTAAAAGFTALLPGGLFRPVEFAPFLDRPAQTIKIRTIETVPGSNSNLVAVVLNYEGQNLRVESGNLLIDPGGSGTLREVLEREPELHEFHFYEVRNIEGRTEGYLLAREGWMEFIALEKNGRLFLEARDPTEP